MTKVNIMNRLPRFDRTTRRSEAAVFASLALAGIVSIVFTASAFVKFVGGSDRIAAALSGEPCCVARKTPATEAPTTATNVTVIQNRRALTTPAAPGKV